MGLLLFGLALIVAAWIGAVSVHQSFGTKAGGIAVGIAGTLIGLAVAIWSSAVYVSADQRAIVIRKLFGSDLDGTRVIAVEGEKGPQAELLPPGWHFGYWPWVYDLKPVEVMVVPRGQIGIVTARDGQSLSPEEVFAPEWSSPSDMLNPIMFLEQGFRGPQLTVLPPGAYPYHPLLHEIELKPVLEVNVGEVAVIKANAGPEFTGDEVETVNGVPIVPKGYRGIWDQPLQPDRYRLHPDAYVVTRVSTTDRIYHYIGEEGIKVRSQDGFEFPVDVRVSVNVSADNAPYVVAQLAKPDEDTNRSGFTTLEDRAILPVIRAIFRNTAETQKALQYVNSRSEIERLATEQFATALANFRLETEGVFVADIGLSESEAGRELLATQTQREVADQERETWAKKEQAQNARATAVRAEEEADQERFMAQARAQIEINRSQAEALVELARGEAQAYAEKIEALGGVENMVLLELMRQSVEQWDGELPEVLTVGAAASGDAALTGSMLRVLQQQQQGN